MKKLTAIFEFSKPYSFKSGGKTMKVSVHLEINYQEKTYQVFPGPGVTRYAFEFSHLNTNTGKWRAIVDCIDDAMVFAQKEIRSL